MARSVPEGSKTGDQTSTVTHPTLSSWSVGLWPRRTAQHGTPHGRHHVPPDSSSLRQTCPQCGLRLEVTEAEPGEAGAACEGSCAQQAAGLSLLSAGAAQDQHERETELFS